MKKTLYLMRHGQTLFNLRRKMQGHCDSPLTPLGVKQAEIAGKYFENINFEMKTIRANKKYDGANLKNFFFI